MKTYKEITREEAYTLLSAVVKVERNIDEGEEYLPDWQDVGYMWGELGKLVDFYKNIAGVTFRVEVE